mmetsp:Transcript_9351/g.28615  ORF Transcript_9351/g.28615 Transcript_9351/m.28615 type:complete len:199 (+) Transcript_9351:540-1136(+)
MSDNSVHSTLILHLFRSNRHNDPSCHYFGGKRTFRVGSFYTDQIDVFEEHKIQAAEANDRNTPHRIISQYIKGSRKFRPNEMPNRPQLDQIVIGIAEAIDFIMRKHRDADNPKIDVTITRMKDMDLGHQYPAALMNLLHRQLSPSYIPVILALERQWLSARLLAKEDPLQYIHFLLSIVTTKREFCDEEHEAFLTEEN